MSMWAFARYHLHLSAEDFFALTPRQFGALTEQHSRRVESHELLFAQLTSWVANTGFRTTEKPVNTLDFMPSQWRKPAAQAKTAPAAASKPKRMTAKRRAEVATAMRSLFPPR